MNVHELSREPKNKLKQSMLKMPSSWTDIASTDEIVSDEQLYEHYADTDFTADDSFCSSD